MIYIKINDKNCNDEYGNLQIDETKFHHITNSPMSRCYKTVKTLYKPHQQILRVKEPSVMKAPPTYKIAFQKIYLMELIIVAIRILEMTRKMKRNMTSGRMVHVCQIQAQVVLDIIQIILS